MKRAPSKNSQAAVLAPIFTALLVCMLPFLLADVPSWWSGRGVITTDAAGNPVAAVDFAPANQGQLKELAIATYEEFLATLPAELGGIGSDTAPVPGNPADKGSPGWRIRQLVSQWVVLNTNGTVKRDINNKRVLTAGAAAQKDFAAINLGQIKAVAAPFYDRLADIYWSYNKATRETSQIDPAWAKPWTGLPEDANDHAMATLGQLKNTFAIHLDSDGDSDGLTNLSELLKNKQRSSSDPTKWTDLGNAYTSGGVLTDGDQDGIGLDPTDPINGVPPAAPTGLHITFRDATVHPLDPDLSQVQVEWSAPTQTGVAVTFSSTYAGNPGDWVTVMPPTTSSSDPITVPYSKRIYQYRVTFTAPNQLTASTDIAYELPVIRGIMLRRTNPDPSAGLTYSFTFPGVRLYNDVTETGVPKKFRKYVHTWTYDETLAGVNGVTHHHENGSHTQTFYPTTRSYLIASEEHRSDMTTVGTTTTSSGEDYTYDLNATEPGAKAESGDLYPKGSATAIYTGMEGARPLGDHRKTKDYTRNLYFELARFPVLAAAGNAQAPRPFFALSPEGSTTSASSDDGDRFSGYGPKDSDHTYWLATPSLQADADGQHLQWSGNLTWEEKVDGTTTTHTTPNYVGDLSFGLPYKPKTHFKSCNYLDVPMDVPFEDWGDNPPDGAEVKITPSEDGLSWTRTYTYPDPAASTATATTDSWSWSETITLSDEVTTQAFLDATVATQAPLSVVGWYVPDGSTPQYRFTNNYSVKAGGLYQDSPQLNAWLGWDYSASYTSGAANTGVSGGSAGWPVDGYVTVAPQISGLVGQYSLSLDEASGHLLSSEYKFRIYPPAESCTIGWLETFTPDLSEADQTTQSNLRTYAVAANQTEMPDSDLIAVDRTEAWSTSATTATPGAAAPQAPATKHTGQVRLDGPSMVEFKELFTKSGFDGAIKPNWLMVPQYAVNSVSMIAPASGAFALSLKLDPVSSKELVTPVSVVQSPETITVYGTEVGDTSQVKVAHDGAMMENGLLNVSVKQHRNVSVAIHAITQKYTIPRVLPPGKGEPNQVCIRPKGTILFSDPGIDDVIVGNTITAGPNGVCDTIADPHDQQVIKKGHGIPRSLPPRNVPTAENVQNYLNRAYGVQANVYFNVTRTDFDVDYDKNGNGKLDYKVQAPWSDEQLEMERLAYSPGAKYNIYFVSEFAGVFTFLDGTQKMEGGPFLKGRAISARNIAYLHGYDRAFSRSIGDVFCSPEKAVAHEIGHLLGLRHPDINSVLKIFNEYGDEKDRLMYSNPISLDDGFKFIKPEWDIINKNLAR